MACESWRGADNGMVAKLKAKHGGDFGGLAGNTPVRFAIESGVAALEGLIYPHDLAVRDGVEQVGDGSHASGSTTDDNSLGLVWLC